MPQYLKITNTNGVDCFCSIDDFKNGKLSFGKTDGISSITQVEMTEDEYFATFDNY